MGHRSATLLAVEQPARFEPVINVKIACALGIMAVQMLIGSTRTMSDPAVVFRQRLRELGNVEGRNMIVDIDELDGRFDQLPMSVRVGA